MASFITEQSRSNSIGSPWSSRFSFTPRGSSYDDEPASERKSSWQDLFRKRQRTSPSPHRPLQSATSTRTSTPTKSASSSPNDDSGIVLSSHDLAMVNQLLNTTQNLTSTSDRGQKVRRCQQKACRASPRAARRRSTSSRLRELCAPQALRPEELEDAPVLSLPESLVGNIWQPRPSPGWRIETKPRDLELCIPTAFPSYSANLHSPLVTGKSRMAYVEAENRPRNGEDGIESLMLGFVAGEDRVSKMPGHERWSIGIQCFDGRLYVNESLVDSIRTGGFEPGQRLGIGLTFAVGDPADRQTEGSCGSSGASSSIVVEVFVTRGGERIRTWKMHDLLERFEELSFECLEGRYDLYAAVGTMGEANVDILLEKKDWMYADHAG